MTSSVATHWNAVYDTKAPNTVSWYRAHLEQSLELIKRAAPERSATIIDIGGGESTLVDDLLGLGYRNVTVLDISSKAIEVSKKRVGELATYVTWLSDDITEVTLPNNYFDVWHDRAVFHFLTKPEQREAYVRRVRASMKPGGHVIVATFGPQGPTQCSGLDVVRYDADSLYGEFGPRFRLIEHLTEIHQTPFGTTQQFVYCFCKAE